MEQTARESERVRETHTGRIPLLHSGYCAWRILYTRGLRLVLLQIADVEIRVERVSVSVCVSMSVGGYRS